MVGAGSGGRWVRITAEVVVEVRDAAALEREALAHVDGVEFSVDDGSVATVEQVRAGARDAVRGDPLAALEILADPSAMVDSVAGVHALQAEYRVEDIGREGGPLPDFAALFPPCGCDDPACAAVTPRTAAVLWSVGQVLAGFAYDDVLEHGDDPVGETVAWSVFDEFPRATWHRDAVWRRLVARSFDDLSLDLESGRRPVPRSRAEEVVLSLMVRHARAAVADGWESLEVGFTAMPRHRDDFDWASLVDTETDTDPGGTDDVAAWHTPFPTAEKRDPRRPFRR
ncbi:hypothetical protein ACFFQW_15675 [Umezawaea endophytica]|uniref:Uncharacterized protein n=1 Tax=Umezawaea endophytica TaxID=1654476 RepID=A0A9X2VG07_9PSEU|nr:hypothetical protein [Umezawaea endophytica]MCS7475387.1 hypothetical protein [Umezawaea endophytica]